MISLLFQSYKVCIVSTMYKAIHGYKTIRQITVLIFQVVHYPKLCITKFSVIECSSRAISIPMLDDTIAGSTFIKAIIDQPTTNNTKYA